LNQKTLISQALALTEKVLSLAESDEWETFAELEQQRLQIIQQIDTSNLTLSDADEARNSLQKMIELNARLQRVCEESRQFAANELKSLKKGASAIKAYKN